MEYEYEYDHEHERGSDTDEEEKVVMRGPPLSREQREELKRLYIHCPQPSTARLQKLVSDCPSLSIFQTKHLKAWFQHRRKKAERDENLCFLISKNTKLKTHNQSLLLHNNHLRSQAALLDLENQLLRQELQRQLSLLGSSDISESDNDDSVTSVLKGPEIGEANNCRQVALELDSVTEEKMTQSVFL